MNNAFPLGRSLLAAALIIASSAALAWLAPDYLSAEWSQRLLGLLLGAVVVVYSNTIPKVLVARRRGTAAQDQAARRLAGWALVLGGLGYMLAWLLAPLQFAALSGGALLATGLLVAVIACLRVRPDSSAT